MAKQIWTQESAKERRPDVWAMVSGRKYRASTSIGRNGLAAITFYDRDLYADRELEWHVIASALNGRRALVVD